VVLYYTNAENTKQSVLLPEVNVLAVGATSTVNQGATPQPASSLITLAVDNLQAKKIILAQKNGSIYFGLLNKTTVVDPGATLDIKQITGN
jgi:Flp pilus assembly protein CpaB